MQGVQNFFRLLPGVAFRVVEMPITFASRNTVHSGTR